jgi:hypothetical protein
MSKYKKLDFTNIKTYSLKERSSKVSISDFAKTLEKNTTFKTFLDSIPNILAGKEYKEFIKYYRQAVSNNSTIIFMIGAHVIKTGISPLIINAMEKGLITHLALNGACAIHDTEIALWGFTSEDVAQGIQDGSFGMAEESTHLINTAIHAGKGKMGYGEAIARALSDQGGRYLEKSLLYSAYKLNIPLTVHSALGTEIIHQHPGVDGAAAGDTAWTDFQIFSKSVSSLEEKSIVVNIGSAVIMPELFLKALTVVRNLGYPAFGFTTAVFDMIHHYRPRVNVVERPTKNNGKGYYFIGHHELMLPLLFASLESYL